MKILVTGGAGFIGSHLCEKLLSDDRRVVCLDNFNDFYDPRIKRANIRQIQKHPKVKNFKSIAADILNLRRLLKIFKMEKPDAVIHLAAMAGVRPSLESPALYARVNVRGTFFLLEACRETGVRHFIFGSSSSVYGNLKIAPFLEKAPTNAPISPYAATKKAGEILCEFYAQSHRLCVAALRFFTAYGPRQRPDLAIHKFTRLMSEGKPIPFFGDGSMKRDYTFVHDIVGGVTAALRWTAAQKGDRGVFETFNLGESKSISLSRMVSTLERLSGKKASLHRLPQPPGDVNRTDADISKARRMLGYRPSTNFEEGIEKFIQWFNSQEKNHGKILFTSRSR